MELLLELLPYFIAVATGVAGWAIGRLDKFVESTKTTIDDELLEALRTAFAKPVEKTDEK